MKSDINKKGFTMIEILVVVAILSVLSVVVIGLITHYINKGKNEYDNSLENQFLLAGKDYYSNYPNELPKKTGESNFVSLAELKSLNIVKNDFVDSDNNKCSNADSLVMITNNGEKKYTYNACLVCPGSSRFSNNDMCTSFSYEEITTCKIIESDNDGYIVYDKDGKSKEYTSPLDAVEAYINAGCYHPGGTCTSGTIDGINFYYGENDGENYKVYENKEAAQNAGECQPDTTSCPESNYSITPSYYNLSSCTSSYKCAMNTNSFSNISSLITGLNAGVDENISTDKTYYSYYLNNSAFNTITTENKSVNSTPSYSSSGTNATVTEYFKDVRKKRSTLLNSSYSYVNKNKAIPAEYSFQLGSSGKKATITNPYKMSWADVKKWGSDYYTYATPGEVSLAKEAAKGKYKARYYNVGTYNGNNVDVVMTLVGFGGCKLSSGTSKCGIWFGNKILDIYSIGVEKITVKYNFYIAGTNTPIYVKGYTTYWDIDAHQGIHFVKNTTGLYVYSGNATYISSVNGAPYIYDYYDKKYSGYNGAGAVSETFAGTYMQKTFTFMSGRGTNYSKITSSKGHIYHSTIPAGISMSYYSGANTSSVLKNGSEVKYILRFSNPTSSSKSVKVTINTDKMVYVSGSAKFSDGTKKNPSVSGNTLTWTKTIGALKTDYVIFTLKVPDKSACGEVVAPSAKSVVGSTTYTASSLTNPVICPQLQTPTCIE
ncbi:MAG: type II secretion system protein [Bacilli bacterium]